MIDDLITDIERAPPRWSEEAQWYFISNFKTYAEVIVDGNVMSFVNTPDDNHAEDNMMAALDKYVEEQR